MLAKASLRASLILAVSLLLALLCAPPTRAQALNPAPPDKPVKLIFIHHSTGGNWLADPTDDQPSGGLGIALRDSNYYVSATNYGWGPGNIGDRTDIPNWPEWFAGPDSDRALQALYKERGQNSGDFGAWSRLGRDPGGENEVIVFKSCFPNSDLYGNPGDSPAAEAGGDLTVSNAKAVYNSLLPYFATRQDKLFVVITAPPLAEFDYGTGDQPPVERSANARALNAWLVDEWLAGYPHANVAVFDYYNVLTSNGGDPETSDLDRAEGNHHRWRDGRVEHTRTVHSDYAAYPSGDSHPSSAGHRKATAEFVPLLNVFYHRWKDSAGAPVAPASPAPTEPPQATMAPAPTADAAPPEAAPPAPAQAAGVAPEGIIENWEDANAWHCNDDGQGSKIEGMVDPYNTHEGVGALRIAYKLVEGGWSDCGASFPAPVDWSGGSGLSLALHADKAGLPLVVVLYAGNPDASTPFTAMLETVPESVSKWVRYDLPWDGFARAEWADAGGIDKLDPSRILGLAINLTEGEGTIWLDTITLLPAVAPGAAGQIAAPEEVEQEATAAPGATDAAGIPTTATPEPAATGRSRGAPCASAMLMPLALGWVALAHRRR